MLSSKAVQPSLLEANGYEKNHSESKTKGRRDMDKLGNMPLQKTGALNITTVQFFSLQLLVVNKQKKEYCILIGLQDIIGTNLLAKFHEDRKINVAPRVKNAPPPGSHVYSTKRHHFFYLFQDIIRMNLLTKFHEDWTVNVASRVLTRFYYSHIRKNTYVLTKFHEDWIINVDSRVLTRFYYSHIRKNAPPFGSHVFQANITIFELIQDIIETNLLTKFHEDWTINVASRELTRQMLTPHDGTDKK
ncbi:hypothetical protein DPMN_104973 [Dreissena polymorpha]|uniref:Uncharacterized protein n=1 Tax=Dreissena polymorpha TaxID=45954 RepID=A0A9D4HCZ8_DREPO|nr:hypothetical protein DPMN_104973 [Dreissena polymorpha]